MNQTKDLSITIRSALARLFRLGQKSEYVGINGAGCPVSHLNTNDIIRVSKEILDKGSLEYRLNGAGLKLYGSVTTNSKTGEKIIRLRVWGDQRHSYPDFVNQANVILAELRLQ